VDYPSHVPKKTVAMILLATNPLWPIFGADSKAKIIKLSQVIWYMDFKYQRVYAIKPQGIRS
jgi:hypothetical protein